MKGSDETRIKLLSYRSIIASIVGAIKRAQDEE
jgi:hypothetical protein